MAFSKISSFLIFLVALCLFHSIYAQTGDTVKDFLNTHNFARRAVGNKDVEWCPKLETYAKEYASKHLHDCQLIHTGGPYGENLAMGWGMLVVDAACGLKGGGRISITRKMLASMVRIVSIICRQFGTPALISGAIRPPAKMEVSGSGATMNPDQKDKEASVTQRTVNRKPEERY